MYMGPNDDIQELCCTWQRILRLQDWHIVAKFDSSANLGDSEGSVLTWRDGKEALVRVMSPMEVNHADAHEKAFPYDPEKCLVHELLHIHFDILMDDNPLEHEQTMQEQAIDLIADALVELKRGNVRG